jgi:hypothetical protein
MNLDYVAAALVHEGGEGLELLGGEAVGERGNNVLDPVLARQHRFERIAGEDQLPFPRLVGVEDMAVRPEPIREGQRRAFVRHGLAAIGDQLATPIMDRNGETSSQDALGGVAGAEGPAGLLGQAKSLDLRVRRLKIGEGIEETTLLNPLASLLGNRASGTGAALLSRAVVLLAGEKACGLLHAAVADVGGEGDDVAAHVGAEAVEGILGGRDHQRAGAAASAGRTRAAVLAVGVLEGEIEARDGLLDWQPGLELGEVDEGHEDSFGMYNDSMYCTARLGPSDGVIHTP